MQLGLGLYARMLTRKNLRFARQAGANAIVVHMADFRPGGETHDHFDADAKGWDVSQQRGVLWEESDLKAIRVLVESEGLELAALENLNPALWSDILLDGPQRQAQLSNVQEIIRRIGGAGIGVLGYNFTIAGVWGQIRRPWARGGASTLAFSREHGPEETPLMKGWVWNRRVEPDAPNEPLGIVDKETVLNRLDYFLEAVLPVAEESGVRLAIHPDDPPAESLRGAARSISSVRDYDRLLERHSSPANALEFCAGTVAEMPGADLYDAIDRYTLDRKVAYIHLRNVRGKFPEYTEVFLDEGDIDLPRFLSILRKNNFDGVVTPDHAPLMECDAPWHSGMAWTLGYLRGAIQAAKWTDDHQLSCSSSCETNE